MGDKDDKEELFETEEEKVAKKIHRQYPPGTLPGDFDDEFMEGEFMMPMGPIDVHGPMLVNAGDIHINKGPTYVIFIPRDKEEMDKLAEESGITMNTTLPEHIYPERYKKPKTEPKKDEPAN